MSGAGTREMDRARFVKLAGVGAGAAVTGSLVKAGGARAATRIPLRVAVMMPSGSRYPTMAGASSTAWRWASPARALSTRRP